MGKFVTYIKEAQNIYEAIGRASAVMREALALPNPFDYILKVEHVGGWWIEFEIEKVHT